MSTLHRWSEVLGLIEEVLESAPLSLRPIEWQQSDDDSIRPKVTATEATTGARARSYSLDLSGGDGAGLGGLSSSVVEIVQSVEILLYESLELGQSTLQQKKDALDVAEDVLRQLWDRSGLDIEMVSVPQCQSLARFGLLITTVALRVRYDFSLSAE